MPKSTTLSLPDPRWYQEAALEKIRALREERGVNKCLVVMASGLGKTYLAAFDIRNFEREDGCTLRVLYLAHQTLILEQAHRSFRKVFGELKTYGHYDGSKKEKSSDIVFATFQSMSERLHEFTETEFDYVVVDEAHHSAADTRSKILNFLQPRFLLGLTATPYRFDGKDILKFYDDLVAYNLPLEMALVKDLLTPIHYIVFTDKTNPTKLTRAFEGKTKDIFEPRRDDEIIEIIKSISRRNFASEKTIVFCTYLKQVHHYSRLFENCIIVTGEESKDEQIRRIDAFQTGEYSILLARDVLNEGVDVPDANMIVFLRNSASPVVFLQQLGRGLRKAEGKKKVIALDFVGNIDRIRFLYSFYSRLRAFLQATRIIPDIRVSTFEFDETACNVIKALLLKKCRSQAISPVRILLQSSQIELSIETLTKFVAKGRLVPDYEFYIPELYEKYFLEKSSVPHFLRQISNHNLTTDLIGEIEFARRVGTSVSELHRKEMRGEFCPTWVHKSSSSKRVQYYYDSDDLVQAKKMWPINMEGN